MITKLVLPAVFVGLLVQFGSSSLLGQELPSNDIQQVLSWSTEGVFAKQMGQRFSESILAKELRFDRLSSVVAIPVAGAEKLSLDDLAKGALIGGVYLSSGSTRLKLAPGAYVVRVRFDQSTFTWKIDHLDPSGKKIIATVDARVQPAVTIEVVASYVDHSVCYRADSWVVCY